MIAGPEVTIDGGDTVYIARIEQADDGAGDNSGRK